MTDQKRELVEWYEPSALTFDTAEKMASRLAGSDLVPAMYRGKPGNVFAALALCAGLNIKNAIVALGNIAVINGKPSLWGDLPLAIARGAKRFAKIEESFEGTYPEDEFTAVCRVWVADMVAGGFQKVEERYSIADAKTAGLWDKRGKEGKPTPWVTNPRRMLKLRARGFLLRDTFADELAGCSVGEAASDDAEDYVEKVAEVTVKDAPEEVPAKTDAKPGATVEVEEFTEETEKPKRNQKPKAKPPSGRTKKQKAKEKAEEAPADDRLPPSEYTADAEKRCTRIREDNLDAYPDFLFFESASATPPACRRDTVLFDVSKGIYRVSDGSGTWIPADPKNETLRDTLIRHLYDSIDDSGKKPPSPIELVTLDLSILGGLLVSVIRSE